MVNGVVVISPTLVTVFVIFVYLCEFMDSRSRCDCIGLCFASRLFFDDPCNDFFQLVMLKSACNFLGRLEFGEATEMNPSYVLCTGSLLGDR